MDQPSRRAAQALYRFFQAARAYPDREGLERMLLEVAHGDLATVLHSGHPLVPLLLESDQARRDAGLTMAQAFAAMEELHPEMRLD